MPADRRSARLPRTSPQCASADTDIVTVDLDEKGRPLDPETGGQLPGQYLRAYFEDALRPPATATDLLVYVHGWQTPPASALRAALKMERMAQERVRTDGSLYPRLARNGFRPWTVLVRWPSSSLRYGRIRDRAHTMGDHHAGGHAAHVIGRLLGYLNTVRPDPARSDALATDAGQYLHLVGHSFGCRLLCEAAQWAAQATLDTTLGWTATGEHPDRPFSVDSMLLLQMAASRDAFVDLFPSLVVAGPGPQAPLGGPVVATHSRYDRATGVWHLLREGRGAIGHSGIGRAPAPVSRIPMMPVGTAYPRSVLDHRFVGVDASRFYVRGRRLNPAGAHSDHLRPETAHLLASLAEHSR
ncbi:hypothetical protein ACWEQJ_07655 [Streptomyces cyaneofuscatus]